MKPMPLTIPDRARHDLFDPTERQPPRTRVTDYNYHSVAYEGFSGRYMRNSAQPFWNIAGNYLKDEARHEYWSEAMLFAFITVTAVLTLMNNLHALIEFARAISSH